MESYGLDMEDIFDTEANLDDDLAAPRSMPDLEDDDTPINRNFGEGEENGDEDAPDADVLSKLKDISKGAAKKKVMRPQPKLDLERLQSKRGLRALPAAFEAVKFKGKGHEAADLGLLMGKLEHWAHRLYPKLPFDDFVERLEKLGAKKQVQTCIKRIRLDMEDLGADDVVRGEGEEENTDKPEEGAAAAAAAPEFTDLDAEEAYEEMMREERERAEKRKSKEGDFSSPRTPHKSNTDVVETDSPARSQSQKQNPTKSPGNSQPAKSGGMTEEQIARMERNRQLAIERRLAKFGQSPAPGSKVQSASQKVPESPDKPSDKPQPKPDEKPLPSKSKTNVEEAGDQGTAEELEAMLNDDIGEELTANKCTDDSMNLHLTESLSTQSEQPMTQQNAQGSRSEVEADSEERAPQKSVTESEGKEESDKLDLPMTVTESEGVGNDKKAENSELELRLTATVSEEKDSMEEEESDALKLRLTATETEATERSESTSETQKLQLRLSESEVAAENSDSLNLKLSETQDTESTSVPTRKESDSDNMNLRLDMSVSEEESGDV